MYSNGVFQQEIRDQRMAAEEQMARERRDREQAQRRKDNSCIANASPEVKLKLQVIFYSQ